MKRLFPLLLLFLTYYLAAQNTSLEASSFKVSGDAFRLDDNCFQLTAARMWEGGSVWYGEPIDLEEDFEMEIDLKFGCSDDGADGIVFIFHDKLRTGIPGEGMGFGGLQPSLGIEMDTHQNHHRGDPYYDHLALIKNGGVNHNNEFTKPIPLLPRNGNIEDCNAHRVKITWQPKLKLLKFLLDGNLLMERKYDIVKNIFGGNPNVFWGFSAATGGSYNRQEVCLEKLKFTSVSVFDVATRKKLLKGDPYSLRKVDFLSGQTTLLPEADKELNRLVDLLRQNEFLEIYVQGHTDSSGGARANLNLSQKRAESVRQYLIDKGISKKRIHAIGYGETHPKTDNGTAEGRKINRRVDIILVDPRA